MVAPKPNMMIFEPSHDIGVVSDPGSTETPCIESLLDKGVHAACFVEVPHWRCK